MLAPESGPSSVVHSHPWLDFDLGQEMSTCSFAPYNGGLTLSRRILWRQVRDAELPIGLDPLQWLASEVKHRDAADAVCFLTSRNLSAYRMAEATEGKVTATAVVTAGLSNAERIGARLSEKWIAPPEFAWGTVNVAVRLSCALTTNALLEALSLAAEARTVAIMEAGVVLPTGIATGTGTDCIAIAAREGSISFAGKHTDVGLALGKAVYQATSSAVSDWTREAAGW